MTVFDTNSVHAAAMQHAQRRPTIMQRLAVWRSRRSLAQLDTDALKDIGLPRGAAQREASKMFWDVPASWIE